jgi:hypothetical protein
MNILLRRNEVAMNASHPAYEGAIALFLQEHGPATPGRLQYHIAGKREVIEACLTAMEGRGQVERCGVETSGAYGGQPLYQAMKVPWAEEQATIVRHLVDADEELLGLQRNGVLTYEQYTDVANLLLEAREKLKGHMKRFTRQTD